MCCVLKFNRILVVDDLIDNLILLKTFLELEGYEVETANCGTSAIAKIENSPPDLVLLDVMMPDMTGYEVAHWIRQTLNLCDIPIVLISAYGDLEMVKDSEIGANAFLHKPVDFDELLINIKGFCN